MNVTLCRRIMPDVVSVNTLMDACAYDGYWHLALDVLSATPVLRVTPNHISHMACDCCGGGCGHSCAPNQS